MTKRFTAHRPKPPKGRAAPRPARVPAGGASKAPGEKATDATGPKEIGGPRGLEPTRYGDWERNGICVDF